MLCIDDLSELSTAYTPVEFRVREAANAWERREAHALRRTVFCIEQGLFQGDDRDAIDSQAQLLVALACTGGLPEQVVGTVRIHSPEPGLWWGSRLAVHPAFRSQGQIGATLIRLAVGRAHAQGCTRFLAHVQQQNVPLFLKRHWVALDTLQLHGRPHSLMQAALAAHPPCHDAAGGVVTLAREGRA